MRLIGVVRFRDQLAMVSPWLENGDLKSFIRDNPGVDRCALCTRGYRRSCVPSRQGRSSWGSKGCEHLDFSRPNCQNHGFR
ncbi:hypothetical protein RSOL_371740 [Rhizoctonia solani AG-3 Rhs1AP]|uniref:Uncharacterized protein n=1 Tax=Rhizoctonia solani AG-3 Rhs1AP TaxID=1086054 RepID=X8JB42_9AGAM|nr:hypothetical protein RSOL_371740 [Rhizoctonia solani AG-3 Rhs1AP]